MSRIFDAIRKARAVSPEPVAPAPVPEPPRGPVAAMRTPQARPALPVAGLPLAGAPGLSDEDLQQMTRLRVGVEAALQERPTRVVAFVSSQGREGSTTVAHEFAVALAGDDHHRVVIVDANAQNPSLDFDPEHGVTRIHRRTRLFAPRGGEPASNLHGWALPDEIRESGLFRPGAARSVIEGLAASYDWVILDLPSALESTDAPALAAMADGTVLVIRAGRTKRPVLSRSVDLLRKAGARVIGTVLNRRRLEIPDFIYKRI
jgi:Mrp family chromosome partitioning ATPase